MIWHLHTLVGDLDNITVLFTSKFSRQRIFKGVRMVSPVLGYLVIKRAAPRMGRTLLFAWSLRVQTASKSFKKELKVQRAGENSLGDLIGAWKIKGLADVLLCTEGWFERARGWKCTLGNCHCSFYVLKSLNSGLEMIKVAMKYLLCSWNYACIFIVMSSLPYGKSYWSYFTDAKSEVRRGKAFLFR